MSRYFPCQLPDGSTYVVDSRDNSVVQTIDRNPDTAARWAQAKRACAARNKADGLHRRVIVQRTRVGCLLLALLWIVIASLSAPIIRAISSAL